MEFDEENAPRGGEQSSRISEKYSDGTQNAQMNQVIGPGSQENNPYVEFDQSNNSNASRPHTGQMASLHTDKSDEVNVVLGSQKMNIKKDEKKKQTTKSMIKEENAMLESSVGSNYLPEISPNRGQMPKEKIIEIDEKLSSEQNLESESGIMPSDRKMFPSSSQTKGTHSAKNANMNFGIRNTAQGSYSVKTLDKNSQQKSTPSLIPTNGATIDRPLREDLLLNDSESEDDSESTDEEIKQIIKQKKFKQMGKLQSAVTLIKSIDPQAAERLQKKNEKIQKRRIDNKKKLTKQMNVEKEYAGIVNKFSTAKKFSSMEEAAEIMSQKEQGLKKDQIKVNERPKNAIESGEDLVKSTYPVSASENMMTYLKNYSVNFEIPSSVVKGCKFFSKDPRYCLQLINYIIPGSGDQSQKKSADGELINTVLSDVVTHKQSGKMRKKPYKTQFKKYSEGVILRLIKQDYNANDAQRKGVQVIDQVTLGLENKKIFENNVVIKFSSDSTLLAIFLKKLGKVKVYEIPQYDDKEKTQEILQNMFTQMKEEINPGAKQPFFVFDGFTSQELNQTNIEDTVGEMSPNLNESNAAAPEPDNLGKLYKTIEFGSGIGEEGRRWLILKGPTQFQILDVLGSKNHKKLCDFESMKKYTDKYYDQICDVKVESKERFKCAVACKRQGQKQIDIFEIDDESAKNTFKSPKSIKSAAQNDVVEKRAMVYYNDDKKNSLFCRISEGFEKVILVNGDESYILEEDTAANCRSCTSDMKQQAHLLTAKRRDAGNFKSPRNKKHGGKSKNSSIRRLPQLNERLAKYIYPDKDGNFFLVAFHDYDQFLDIVYTESSQFEVEFNRNIEPDCMKILDMEITTEGSDCVIRLASSRDGGFTIDVARFKITKREHNVPNQKIELLSNQDIEYQTDSTQPIQALSVKWPYVVFSSLDTKHVLILNAFDNNILHRVELPDEPDKISQTYITETNNLFIVCQKDDKYNVCFIDLDASNRREQTNKHNDKFRVSNLFQYTKEHVNHKTLLDIHIRGSSDKEVIDNNEKLIVILLHEGAVYKWTQQRHNKMSIRQQNEDIRDMTQRLKEATKSGNQEEIKGISQNIKSLAKQFKLVAAPEPLANTSSTYFCTQDDDRFYLLENIYQDEADDDGNKKRLFGQKIVQYTVDFGDVVKETVYSDYINNEKIVNFSIDQVAKKIIIFTRVAKLPVDQQKKFTVYDLVLKKINYEILIYEPNLCGRLESGLYNVVDGHLYFSNDVIKIRYDLIERPDSNNFQAEEIFDFYDGIFKLKKNERVMTNCPIDSISFHKFVYVIKNNIEMKPAKVIVLPYLHEKKIYLNRMKPNTEYFSTSLDQEMSRTAIDQRDPKLKMTKSIVTVNLTEHKYYTFSQRGLLRNRVTFGKDVKKYGEPVAVSQNGLNFILKRKDAKSNNELQLAIFHLTEYDFVKIKDFTLDDTFDTLKKRLRTSQHEDEATQQERVKQGEKIQVMLNINKWTKSKDEVTYKFEINDNMDILIQMKRKKKSGKAAKNDDFRDLTHDDPYKMLEEIRQDNIGLLQGNGGNGNLEQTSQENDTEMNQQEYVLGEGTKQDHLLYGTIYYFQGGQVHIPVKNRDKNFKKIHEKVYNPTGPLIDVPRIQQQFFYFVDKNKRSMILSGKDRTKQGLNLWPFKMEEDGQKDVQCQTPTQFKLNEKYGVFWNPHAIWTVPIDGEYSFKKTNFYIKSDENNQSLQSIKDVRLGSNPEIMVIIVDQSHHLDCILVWSMKKNQEKEAFDVAKDYEILWDYQGNPYVIHEDVAIFTRERCKMKCFEETENLMSIAQQNKIYSGISLQTGHRFDGQGHNWMLLNEYMSLSFSFMTFVIKQKIEESGKRQTSNVFDPTPYTYIFNRSTPFIDSVFVRTDHEQLNKVLSQLNKLDPVYLQQLYYSKKHYHRILVANSQDETYTPRVSALHIAYYCRNTKGIDTLLKYMSIQGLGSTQFFRNIFAELVENKMFSNFVEKNLIQSFMMKEKQILKIPENVNLMNEDIACIKSSNQMYLDDQYFQNVMNEDIGSKTYKSYPVEICALRVDWILQYQHGLHFLEAIDKDEFSSDILQNQAIKILVQFLFQAIEKVMWRFCILNALQLIAFMLSISIGEAQWTKMNVKSLDTTPPCELQKDEQGLDDPNSCKILDFTEDPNWTFAARFLGIINFIFTLIQAILIIIEAYGLKNLGNGLVFVWNFMTKFRVFEVTFIVLNTLLTILQIIGNETMMLQRQISTFVVIVMGLKIMYYLKLIPMLTKHIEAFFDIAASIGTFIVMFLLFILAFSIAFWILGRNQIQYDQLESHEEIDYASFWSALWYVWNICIGNASGDSFFVGDNSDIMKESTWNHTYLIILFILATFILLIHLLNMLIAIMSDQFATNNKILPQIKIQEQLRFVIDKWFYMNLVLKSKTCKYVVAAIMVREESQEFSIIKRLQESQQHMRDNLKQFQDHMFNEMKEMKHYQEEQEKENHNLKQIIGKIAGKLQKINQ